MEDCLKKHNSLRAKHGAPPMKIDQTVFLASLRLTRNTSGIVFKNKYNFRGYTSGVSLVSIRVYLYNAF
jgi:hypothetical protein